MAQSVIINGVTYSNVPSVTIPKTGSGNAVFWDTSGADGVSADTLAGKKVYGASGEITGSMPSNGDTSGTISTKTGTVTIPAGHTSGGAVEISSAEQAKIITGNIKAGITLLGIQGKASVVDTSDATATAASIANGATAYVNGSKVTGTLTAPVISQDSTTKVLSIS